MIEYFIRFAALVEYLQNDLERGYSFKCYQFAVSPIALLEEYLPEYLQEDFDIDDLIEQFDIRQHTDGSFGFALDGLCGFGPFDSVELAEELIGGGSYMGLTICGIFEGVGRGVDADSNGTLFRPLKLLKVVDMAVAA